MNFVLLKAALMTEVIAPASANDQQKPSLHAAGSLPHLWPAGSLLLKYETELLGKSMGLHRVSSHPRFIAQAVDWKDC